MSTINFYNIFIPFYSYVFYADIEEISQAKNLKIYELKQIEKDILIKAIVL